MSNISHEQREWLDKVNSLMLKLAKVLETIKPSPALAMCAIQSLMEYVVKFANIPREVYKESLLILLSGLGENA